MRSINWFLQRMALTSDDLELMTDDQLKERGRQNLTLPQWEMFVHEYLHRQWRAREPAEKEVVIMNDVSLSRLAMAPTAQFSREGKQALAALKTFHGRPLRLRRLR